MAQETAVKIDQLKVQFGHQIVLTDLNLTIPQGQIIGLLGPSGSGKSTLVKSLLGSIPFQAGSISIFGKNVPSLEAMGTIGYMAQNDALYDDLTAMDNLLFFGRLYGLRKEAAKAWAKELVDFVGLGDNRKKAVRYFSGGMKRRLSLAIALINHPRLLLLDEPTVGIDPVLRNKFWDEFKRLKAKGCTILATTHVMDEAARCDRMVFLREGQIIANGTTDELLAQSNTNNIEDAFLAFSSAERKKAC